MKTLFKKSGSKQGHMNVTVKTEKGDAPRVKQQTAGGNSNENEVTELVFILDRSGSMHGLEGDTVGGFNSLVKRQRKLPGKVLISVVLFNSVSEVLYDRVDIAEIHKMTEKDFRVDGCTALIDAMGDAIHHIGNVHKYARPEDVPTHTIFAIMTDGMENASHRYSSDDIKKKVEHQKEKYGWEFLFMGANIDAVETAAHYGIGADRAVKFRSDSKGTGLNYACVSDAVCSMRANGCVPAGWQAPIQADVKNRK